MGRRATTSTLDNKRVTPSRYVGSSTSNLRNGNSKEDLSRSSSSASNSQQDLTKNGYSNNVMKPTTSTPNITARSSPMRITSPATMKSHNAPGTGNSRTTTITSTRLTATRPSR